MGLKEMDFKLLDKVRTVNGKWFSIGFLDNEYRKTLSKKTAHSMFQKGELIQKVEVIKGQTRYINLHSLQSLKLCKSINK